MNEESFKIGLKKHKGKPKFMANIDTTDNIQINGTEIEKATNYKYGDKQLQWKTAQNKKFQPE